MSDRGAALARASAQLLIDWEVARRTALITGHVYWGGGIPHGQGLPEDRVFASWGNTHSFVT